VYDFDIDGRLQVTAGVSLLECSRLVEWSPDQAEFSAVPREIFEFSWRRDVDPVFGRLVCWINFSAGAEMLAKGCASSTRSRSLSSNGAGVPNR
jgi:hypothetical protein